MLLKKYPYPNLEKYLSLNYINSELKKEGITNIDDNIIKTIYDNLTFKINNKISLDIGNLRYSTYKLDRNFFNDNDSKIVNILHQWKFKTPILK